MRARLVVLVAVHAIACGRVGFDANSRSEGADGGTDGATTYPATITLRVYGGGEGTPWGQPLANATVLVDDGDLQTLSTDADGLVTATIDAPARVQVGYLVSVGMPAQEEWRLYAFEEVTGGTSLELGSRSAPPDALVSITVNVQAYPGATTYQMHAPVRCGIGGSTTSTAIVNAFARCIGESIPIFAVAYDNTNTAIAWLDVGTRAVIAGATYTPATTWQPLSVETIGYRQLPANVRVYSKLAMDGGGGRVFTSPQGTLVMGDRDLDLGTFSTTNDTMLTIYQRQSPRSEGYVFERLPPLASGLRLFDSSRMAPLLDAYTLDPVTWTVGAAPRSATLQLVQLEYMATDGRHAFSLHFLPRDTRSLPREVLPSPLDGAAIGTLVGLQVAIVAAESATQGETLQVLLTLLSGDVWTEELPVGWAITVGGTENGTARMLPSSVTSARARFTAAD